MEESLREALKGVSVVLMCGVSGAGKTYCARGLEKEGFVRLSADRIVWEEYGTAYSTLPPDAQSAIYMEAVDRLVDSVPQCLNEGKRVVIDASMCKRRRRDAVMEMCRSNGRRCLILYVDAPRAVLARRLAHRGGSGPDDQLVPESDLDRFLLNFEAPAPDENFIHIRNSNPTTNA